VVAADLFGPTMLRFWKIFSTKKYSAKIFGRLHSK
jgi:hypothetical protein